MLVTDVTILLHALLISAYKLHIHIEIQVTIRPVNR